MTPQINKYCRKHRNIDIYKKLKKKSFTNNITLRHLISINFLKLSNPTLRFEKNWRERMHKGK